MSDEYDWTRDAEWGATDAEALEDLRKREATQRDASRTRKTAAAIGGGAVVAQWPCLVEGCVESVGVSDDVVHGLDVFNAQLARKGEAPIAPGAYCTAHEVLRAELRADRASARRDKMRDTIRQLKEAERPESETALIALLRRQGHPDVEGLLASLAAAKPRRRGSL